MTAPCSSRSPGNRCEKRRSPRCPGMVSVIRATSHGSRQCICLPNPRNQRRRTRLLARPPSPGPERLGTEGGSARSPALLLVSRETPVRSSGVIVRANGEEPGLRVHRDLVHVSHDFSPSVRHFFRKNEVDLDRQACLDCGFLDLKPRGLWSWHFHGLGVHMNDHRVRRLLATRSGTGGGSSHLVSP